jgi:hypothetical protein
MIFEQNNLATQKMAPGQFHCLLDTQDNGSGYVHDFRRALEDGYLEYLGTLKAWINDRLNLKFSAQPSYNLPMDMAVSIPVVDVPECESLGFKESIDAYRRFSGPANLAGKRVISNEMGAATLQSYSYTIPSLIVAVNLAVAGGINEFVLHGQSYTGRYFETTWPGYTPFSYLFAENYSPKQPSWSCGLPEALNYIARVQYVQQKGIPRTDLVFLNKESGTNPDFPTIYADDDLRREGKSIQFCHYMGVY